MFIESYNNFLKNISKIMHKKQNDMFEKNSIGDNPLFALKDYEKPEYYSATNYLTIDFLKESLSEIKNINSKLFFIKGFCTEYQLYLQNIIKKLDKEYLEMQNSISFKGSSFINMIENYPEYNNVVEETIQYKKNISISDTSIYKEDNISTKIDFIIKNYNKKTILLIFDKPQRITETIIEFNRDIIYSLYGMDEDGTTTLLFEDIDATNYTTLTYSDDKKYSQIMLVSDLEIATLLKNAIVYAAEQKVENKYYNSFIVRTYDLISFTEFIFASDSKTTLHKIDESELYDFVTLVNNDETQAISKYCGKSNIIMKNTAIRPEGELNNIYLIEYIGKEIYNGDRVKLYAKEVSK